MRAYIKFQMTIKVPVVYRNQRCSFAENLATEHVVSWTPVRLTDVDKRCSYAEGQGAA